jgi:hypothetical protein
MRMGIAALEEKNIVLMPIPNAKVNTITVLGTGRLRMTRKA